MRVVCTSNPASVSALAAAVFKLAADSIWDAHSCDAPRSSVMPVVTVRTLRRIGAIAATPHSHESAVVGVAEHAPHKVRW